MGARRIEMRVSASPAAPPEVEGDPTWRTERFPQRTRWPRCWRTCAGTWAGIETWPGRSSTPRWTGRSARSPRRCPSRSPSRAPAHPRSSSSTRRSRPRRVVGTSIPSRPRARLVFVGEGPGAEEDNQGIPFVGAAGQLLTKMIAAMGYTRDEVYICNVVKCRPPGNRNPEPDEIAACQPFLEAQLSAIRPSVIVTLGKFAAQTLLRTDTPITRLRGQWREDVGVPLMPTFHPAYLLRTPAEKKAAWTDLQEVMARFPKPGA